MKVVLSLLIAAAAALAAAPTAAQPASGPGPGASAPPAGMGPGMGGPMGPRYGAGVTPGWQMMTPEERAAHQAAMGGMKSQGDCMAYMDKHHQQMMQRAKERGSPGPGTGPRHDLCMGLAKP